MGDDNPQALVPTAADLERFVRNPGTQRVIVCPIESASRKNPYCKCHAPLLPRLWYYLKASLVEPILKQPFNLPKIWLLRAYGAKIGKNVYISVRVWIDPSHLSLLTIEDDVLVGVEARIMMHEYRIREFRAGTVRLGKGCLIGGFSVIGPGVDVGEGATVAAGSVVGKDVAAGVTVAGNPARPVMGSQV
ncbi:MAG: acyltransferase [Deltaproteobacteria bacterium]|nr:acyltransferase [Deltaproteobacteria bacterium]